MLLTVTRRPIDLVGVDDPVISELVNLMPDYSAGRRLHALYVNKLEGYLPGHYSQLFGTGPAFRSVFFPSWRADPLLSLTAHTGLDERWWSSFSIAVLCQAIAELGSRIRGQMLTGEINAAVANSNAELRQRSAIAYSAVLAASYPPLTALLQRIDRTRAKQQFRDALLANVINRQLWWQAGMWTSPDWEMFNQYAKYLALGATDAEVDSLITDLVGAGLPVPAQVGRDGWRTYAEELRDKPAVDLDDIRSDASGPIAATTYLPNYGGGMPAQLPNGNCYEFTANGQPGSPYRRVGGGSCFTGTTCVLDGGGQPVPISTVQRGDIVLTREGPAEVAYLARPLLGERALLRLRDVGSGDAAGPVFAVTHPFVDAGAGGSDPALLAADPAALVATVPTLGEVGVGALRPGSRVWRWGGDDDPVPSEVTALESVPPTPADLHLYDLRFAPGTGSLPFWVGAEDRFFLAVPEYPDLDRAGAAAVAVVAVMEQLLTGAGPTGRGWPAWVIGVLDQFGAGVFDSALRQALAITPSFGAPPPTEPLDRRIERLYAALGGADAETAAVAAALFDGLLTAVGQWLASLVELGWRDGGLLGGDILAITVFDLALTAPNPVPDPVDLRLRISNDARSEHVELFDRRGRANTAFHHFFDQVIHLDLASNGPRPDSVIFSVAGADQGPSVLASSAIPLAAAGDHQLCAVVLRDNAGVGVGELRFDQRRLGRTLAEDELTRSGLWTAEAAESYANALGGAMAPPILAGLAGLAPELRSAT